MSLAQLFDLHGKKAIITGGSRGLGLQIAQALGEMGAQLLLGARKADELDAAVTQLRADGVDASALTVDLGDHDSVKQFATGALAKLGQCDILVNNAGASWVAAAEDHPLDAWLKLVNVNLTGVFLLTQQIGRDSMIPRRSGRILNIASIAGLFGNPPDTNKTVAYSTTKGGLVNFTRALAAEWGPYGITVNALAPGFFLTKMTRVGLAQMEPVLKKITPLQRLGGDEDLKGAALLFCSDASRHITGQILAIDGGATAI
jgi:NAD(P)-dependent dehydrogenase (short-subunit alcohol dehydrogenase family)